MKSSFNAVAAAAFLVFGGLLWGSIAVADPKSTVVEGDTKSLHSPIVITTVFPLVDQALWGTGGMWGNGKYTDPAIYSDIYQYRCDGVQITKLTLRGEPDGNQLAVQVAGKVSGKRASHDKKYSFDLEFMNGDAVVATAQSKDNKVESHDNDDFKFHFKVPQAVLKTDPATAMRITMTTWDY